MKQESLDVKLSWEDALLKAAVMKKAGYTIAVNREDRRIIWPTGRIEEWTQP